MVYPTERYRRQDATYWAPSGRATAYGELSFTDPSGIKVRWTEKGQRFLLPKGEEAISRAVVTVGEDVLVGGYLFLGASTSGDPLNQRGAYPIRQATKSVDARNRWTVRRAFL